MATEILATGSSQTRSTDVVVAAGSVDTIFLKDAAGPDLDTAAVVYVQYKDSAGQYYNLKSGRLDFNRRSTTVTGPLTYAAYRAAGTVGVEKGS